MKSKENQKLEDLIDWNGVHQVKLEVEVEVEDAFTCCFNDGFVVHVYRSREGYVVDT